MCFSRHTTTYNTHTTDTLRQQRTRVCHFWRFERQAAFLSCTHTQPQGGQNRRRRRRSPSAAARRRSPAPLLCIFQQPPPHPHPHPTQQRRGSRSEGREKSQSFMFLVERRGARACARRRRPRIPPCYAAIFALLAGAPLNAPLQCQHTRTAAQIFPGTGFLQGRRERLFSMVVSALAPKPVENKSLAE